MKREAIVPAGWRNVFETILSQALADIKLDRDFSVLWQGRDETNAEYDVMMVIHKNGPIGPKQCHQIEFWLYEDKTELVIAEYDGMGGREDEVCVMADFPHSAKVVFLRAAHELRNVLKTYKHLPPRNRRRASPYRSLRPLCRAKGLSHAR